uniref:Structural polyprotein 2 n=1 Tax=Picornavirales sp. TaxID=1955153 RepID=A0A646R2G2_9VIRU|nr:structural polyprotein 2 [Picornavirales sp.]
MHTPKLHLTVWFYAQSPSVHVPIYRHDYVVSNNTNILRSKPVLEPTMEAIGNAIGSVLGEDAGKAVTSGGNAVGNFFTGNFGDSMRDAGDTLHHVAAALGLDYPTRIITNLTHINPLGPMAVGKGVDSAYSLRLDPQGMQVITSDRKGNTIEECDLDYIKRVPMLVNTVKWTDAEDSGFLLTSWPVTPNICFSYNSGGVTLSTNTFLSYLSGLFQFWRGSLDYRLDFVSTQFHTGRLLVAFVPNLPQKSSPTFEQALSCPNVVIDIQESSSITFSVPFLSQTPYKNTETEIDVLSLTGMIYVFVLNELVRPSNVSDTIEFNIYLSAGDDFEFAVPQPFNYLLYSDDLPPSSTDTVDALPTLEPTMQGLERLETRTGQAISSTKLSLAFGSDMVPPVNTLGEKFSLLDLTKRYARLADSIAPQKPLTVNAFENTVHSRFTTEVVGVKRTVYSPIAVISAMFAGWFGSLRYKFATDASRSSKASLTVMYDPSPTDSNRDVQPIDGFCAPLQRTNLDQNNALEVDIPCYTPYNLLCLPTFNGVRSLPHSAGRVFYQLEVASSETVTFDIYQAGGDDFRPFYLIAPPSDFSKSGLKPKHYFVAKYTPPKN